MFLSAVSFAKSKSKNILVRMVSQAGTGFSFNTKRSRLGEKLTLLHYDPFDFQNCPAFLSNFWLKVSTAAREYVSVQVSAPPGVLCLPTENCSSLDISTERNVVIYLSQDLQ
nr:39S ribosomal protein L33, mitochondrial isoform X1 [Pipistrellus kuhlii]